VLAAPRLMNFLASFATMRSPVRPRSRPPSFHLGDFRDDAQLPNWSGQIEAEPNLFDPFQPEIPFKFVGNYSDGLIVSPTRHVAAIENFEPVTVVRWPRRLG
jgi:hypothetical protein